MELNTIEVAIAKLEAKPGDTVILKCDKPLTVQQREWLREQAAIALPAGLKVMVLDAGLDLVLAPADPGGVPKV